MAGKGKTPGDGQKFTTRKEQDAAKSKEQLRDDKDVKEHGMDGLGKIADRKDPGWRDR